MTVQINQQMNLPWCEFGIRLVMVKVSHTASFSLPFLHPGFELSPESGLWELDVLTLPGQDRMVVVGPASLGCSPLPPPLGAKEGALWTWKRGRTKQKTTSQIFCRKNAISPGIFLLLLYLLLGQCEFCCSN